jgi:rhodanese-related sulfurtransferase
MVHRALVRCAMGAQGAQGAQGGLLRAPTCLVPGQWTCATRPPAFPCSTRTARRACSVGATIHQHEAIKATNKLNTARLVKVSHILCPEDASATLAAVREALQASPSDLADTFASLALQHSTCPSSKSGGDLGWVQVGQMVAEFEDACFRSAPGDIVECSTEYGRHFVYIEAEQAQGEVRPMSVSDLQVLLTTGELGDLDLGRNVQLLDVREPSEVDMSKLPGPWKLYSLSAFGTWGPEVAYMLDPDMTTVVLCHAGVRSAQVCQFLLKNQFRDLRNVTGGIAAYSSIDPNVPTY